MKRHLRDKVLIISGILVCPTLLFILLPCLPRCWQERLLARFSPMTAHGLTLL